MPWSNQVVIATQVIIQGFNDGLFMYNGPPGPGKLIASISLNGGTDPYGNVYLAGINDYVPGVALYAGITNGELVVGNGSPGGAGPWQQLLTIANNSVTGANVITSSAELDITLATFLLSITCQEFRVAPTITRFTTGDFRIEGGALISNAGTAANPTVVTTDAWQTITSFFNGWAATAGGEPCQIRLMPDGLVYVRADVSGGTIATGTNMFQLPSGANYLPTGTERLNCLIAAGATVSPTNTPHVNVTNTGTVQAELFPTGTTRVVVNDFFPSGAIIP